MIAQEHSTSHRNQVLSRSTINDFLLIAVVGFVVFFNSLFNGFVWDDLSYIIHNSEIHSFNLAKIFGPSIFNSTSYYRVVPAAYFSLVYSVVHAQPLLYHVVQLLLHIACTIAVYVLFNRFVTRRVALLLAIIFLVHPINVESVSYISATTSQLYALPGLLALLLLQHHNPTRLRYVAVGLLIFVSLLAKEEGLLFLFIALAFVALFRQKQLKQVLLLETLVFSLYLCIRFAIGNEVSTNINEFLLRGSGNVENTLAFTPIAHLSFYDKLLNVPAIILYYLQTFVFPHNLVIGQIWVAHNNPVSIFLPFIIDIMMFAGILMTAAYIYRYRKAYLKPYVFFLIWLLAGLMFHLPIFIPADMTVADRWFYSTMIGLLGTIGVAGVALLRNQKLRSFAVYGLMILIVVFSLRTMVRNTNYADAITLLKHDAQLQPNYRTELALAQMYIDANDRETALLHYEKSNRLYRTSASLNSLGVLREFAGNINQASKNYLEAYELEKSKGRKIDKPLYQRLSKAMLLRGDFATAIRFSQEGLTSFPEDDTLWYQLAVAESGLRSYTAASKAIEKAISINPSERYEAMRRAIRGEQDHSAPQLQ